MTEQPFLPDNYESWYQRGSEQIDRREYEEAIASFDRALQYDADSHGAWCKKGNALYYLQRYEDALACYEQAARVKPESQTAWENQGLALSQLQRYEEALASLNRAIEIDSAGFRTWWTRGNAHMGLGRSKEAIYDYDKVLELQPDLHEVWVLRGQAFNAMGRYAEALASYEKALLLVRAIGERRTEAEILQYMIFLYHYNGRSREGFAAMRGVISIAQELNLPPDDPLYIWSSEKAMPLFEQLASNPFANFLLRVMGFGMSGKVQSILAFAVWLLFFVSSLILSPLWVLRWLLQRLNIWRST